MPRHTRAILNEEVSEEPIVDGKSLGGGGHGGHLLVGGGGHGGHLLDNRAGLRLHLHRHLQSHRVRLKFVQLQRASAVCLGQVPHLDAIVAMAPTLGKHPLLHELVVP